MDAPDGYKRNTWRKGWMGNVQECYMVFLTNPRINIPQNSSYMATFLLSHKTSKEDEQDMQMIAEE